MRGRPILAGDRGQLVVVVALVLATSLVALALVLNGGIYAENLSTRETSGSAEVTLAVQDAYDEAAVAMRSANRARESTPGEAVNSFEADLGYVSGVVTRDRALRGEAFDVDLRGTTSGYSLQQDDASQNFTTTSGASDWTIAEGVDRLAGGRLGVERGSLVENPADVGTVRNEAFTIVLDDGNTEWRIHLFQSGDDVVVAGGEGDDIDDLSSDAPFEEFPAFHEQDCTVDADTAEVDLAYGTLDGSTCPALAFADNLSSDLTVSFENAERAEGTYRLIVTEDATVVGEFEDPDANPDADPYRAGAVFDATVAVTYEQSDVRYAGERIVFAEPLVYEADD